MRWVVIAMLAACGAGPNQPLLANAPRPNPAAVAGGAAAAAAAITLADPDAATRRPEKNSDTEKAPITVKEHVTSDVLDRLDHKDAAATPAAAPQTPPAAPQTPPADTKTKAPKDALDFSTP